MTEVTSTAVRAVAVVRDASDLEAVDTVKLDYDARFVRRKRLRADGGLELLLDLSETVSLDDGDALELETGAFVRVQAAPEPLLRVDGANLARLAWHIGNRHTPCAVVGDHLLIRSDPVLARMLTQLGAQVTETTAPFAPEGGAYGHGRTLGHSHGEAEGGTYHHHPHTHHHD